MMFIIKVMRKYTHPVLWVRVCCVCVTCGGVWVIIPHPPPQIFCLVIYFTSSGQGQGLPVALKAGRCASTFLR